MRAGEAATRAAKQSAATTYLSIFTKVFFFVFEKSKVL